VAAEPVHPLKLVSLLLQYPERPLLEAIEGLDLAEVEPLSRRQRVRLQAFLDWWRPRSLGELQRAYVEEFEFAKQRSLHLTYHVHGDRRQRGLALLRLRQAYADAGFETDERELPDFLPMLLEFAALHPSGRELLEQNREAIELVSAGLREGGSAYADLLAVVTDAMPGLSARQVSRIRRLASEGPPSEEVGLEPFAPPEMMPPAEEATR
jgi:nitrate reductase delta subunit